jgi:hypothetical protein
MIIRPEAEADLVYARDWYERQREGLGAAFLLCVDEVLERISRTPEMYTEVYRDIRRTLTLRFPYRRIPLPGQRRSGRGGQPAYAPCPAPVAVTG